MPKKKSNSNILKCIICCLEEDKFPHVLRWEDKSRMIFTVLFVHKNNPNWNESHLDLFKALDELSPKKNYSLRPKYINECKVRCKSNLKKLCEEGTLVKGKIKNYDKSIFSVSYQIKDPNGTYRKLMYPYGENPDQEMKMASGDTQKDDKLVEIDFSQFSHYPCLSYQFWSTCEDSGNGSFMNSGEVINSSSDGSSDGDSIHGDKLKVCGGDKYLSQSGSKGTTSLIMDTDISIQYPVKTSTPVGELVEISLYASDQSCYEESKEYLSPPNTAKETSVDEEMEIFSPEESYHIRVIEKENVEFKKTETTLMSNDKDVENDVNFYDLDQIQPSIGLLDDSKNPFMGFPEPPAVLVKHKNPTKEN